MKYFFTTHYYNTYNFTVNPNYLHYSAWKNISVAVPFCDINSLCSIGITFVDKSSQRNFNQNFTLNRVRLDEWRFNCARRVSHMQPTVEQITQVNLVWGKFFVSLHSLSLHQRKRFIAFGM